MAKKGLFTSIVLACALLLAPEVLAAKGVVKNAGGGGLTGSIVVISGTTASNTTQAGDTIIFREITSPDIKEGSLVTFDIVPDALSPTGEMAAFLAFLGSGAVITTNQDKNIDVCTNQALIIKGGIKVECNIDLVGGTLYVYGNPSINGNIKGKNGSSIILDTGTLLEGNIKNGDEVPSPLLKIDRSTIVQGNIKTMSCSNVRITGNTINGNVHLERDTNVTITGNSIDGNLKVEGVTGTCSVPGNTVTGKTLLDARCQ